MPINIPTAVSSLSEAINLRDQYPEAFAFWIAPLATKSGGKRTWYVLRVEGDGEDEHAVGWVKMVNEDEEGWKLPVLDPDLDLPAELPPSPLNLWEVQFIKIDGDKLYGLMPRVRIDPSCAAKDEEPATSRQSATTPRQPGRASAGPNPAHDLLLLSVDQQVKATAAANEQALKMLQAVTKSVNDLATGQAAVQKQLLEEMKRAHEQLAKAEELRDKAIGANGELQNQLAESRENSQFWLTIQRLYGDKPELLHEGVVGLISGILDKIARPD